MIRSEIGRDVLVAGTNIKRDKANQRLGAAEAQLKVALDNMPGALVYTDDNLNILFCNYEVKISDGPVQILKSGDVFYEPPNALHATSRNASATQPLRYLVIQVSDPTKPATVPE